MMQNLLAIMQEVDGKFIGNFFCFEEIFLLYTSQDFTSQASVCTNFGNGFDEINLRIHITCLLIYYNSKCGFLSFARLFNQY